MSKKKSNVIYANFKNKKRRSVFKNSGHFYSIFLIIGMDILFLFLAIMLLFMLGGKK